jgi:putative transposase
MSRPARNADISHILSSSRTFFVTTRTSMERALLQSERNANLLIEVLRGCVAAKRFVVHDFVVMPNHVHALITVDGDISIERAMQFIKGGFSYRVKKEFGYSGEVWQRGFSGVRVEDRENFLKHREYIAQNPVRAGLANSPESYPSWLRLLSEEQACRGSSPINFCRCRHD